MDFEQFFDLGDRRRNGGSNDFNPLGLLMEEFIGRQFGGNNHWQQDNWQQDNWQQDWHQQNNHHRDQNINRKAGSIADNLDYGYIDDALRQLDRNIPKFGNRLLNRVQQFESPGYGADLQVFPVTGQRGRNSDLVRMVFPYDRTLACQDIGLLNRRSYTSLTHTQPYFCPPD